MLKGKEGPLNLQTAELSKWRFMKSRVSAVEPPWQQTMPSQGEIVVKLELSEGLLAVGPGSFPWCMSQHSGAHALQWDAMLKLNVTGKILVQPQLTVLFTPHGNSYPLEGVDGVGQKRDKGGQEDGWGENCGWDVK